MGMSLEITTRNEVPASVGYDEIFITWLPTLRGRRPRSWPRPPSSTASGPCEPGAAHRGVQGEGRRRRARDRRGHRTLHAQGFLHPGRRPAGRRVRHRGRVAGDGRLPGFRDRGGRLSRRQRTRCPTRTGMEISAGQGAASRPATYVTQWSLERGRHRGGSSTNRRCRSYYLGVPNRCSLKQLVRFAAICGVENSIKGAMSNPLNHRPLHARLRSPATWSKVPLRTPTRISHEDPCLRFRQLRAPLALCIPIFFDCLVTPSMNSRQLSPSSS